jgi:hypothetical protein
MGLARSGIEGCFLTIKTGGFEGGTRLANAFNQDTVSYFRIAGAAFLSLLFGLILVSVPAAAEVYPVSGVWTAIDTDFPAAANEACVAVKTFGVEAVSKKIYLGDDYLCEG